MRKNVHDVRKAAAISLTRVFDLTLIGDISVSPIQIPCKLV